MDVFLLQIHHMGKMRKVFSWSVKTLKGLHFKVALLFVISIIIASMNVLSAACLKLLLDIATRETSIPLWIGILLPILYIVINAFFESLNIYLKEKTVLNISGNIKGNLLMHIEKLPYSKFEQYHSGDLLTRISDDSDNAANIIIDSVFSLLSGIMSCIFAFSYSLYLSWKMTVVVIILSPLVIIWSKLILPKLQNKMMKSKNCEGQVRGFFQEQLGNIIAIKSFLAYRTTTDKFNILYSEKIKYSLKAASLSALLSGGSMILGFSSFIASVSLGTYLILNGEITVGTVIGFTQMLNSIIWPFTGMMSILSKLQSNASSAKRIIEIMEIEEEDALNSCEFEELDNVELIIENLKFSYKETEGDINLLDNINLNLNSKQLVGVTGESGCGKTTLIKLILNLYEPSSGSITLKTEHSDIAGVNIRRYISYVPQDHILFSATVEENIKFGNENVTIEEVINAAKKANIHSFITSLPCGYKTIINENGKNISFGQAQRIAIARALIKKAPIIILDEPTASLDSESEDLILKTLKNESEKRLCIMVTHNKNSHQKCDKVINL